MQKTFHKKQKGFTIIEILLYLCLSVVMVTLIGGVGVNVLSSITSARVEEDLQYNALFVIEKVQTYLYSAEGIETPLTTGTSSRLTLTMSDPLKNPTIIETIEGSIFVKEGEGEPLMLSGRNVISSAEFTNVTEDEEGSTLRIGLHLEMPAVRSGINPRSSTAFYTTINLQHP
ncbi:MAG: type II secretion system protein [Minisyncoccia bacterium]